MNGFTYVRKVKSGRVNDHGHTYKFLFESSSYFTELLNIATVG
jgi:hypothetical protein